MDSSVKLTATAASPAAARGGAPRWSAISRWLVMGVLATLVLAPLSLVVYQSLLDQPFFMADKSMGLAAYRFVFTDPDFWSALGNSLVIAAGMALIAIPLGGVLAFLMARTDLPGRRWLEPLLLTPVFVSPMVLAFGYVVAAGPVGFYSLWFKQWFGVEELPWNIYSLASIAVVAGLTHVPHVYLYASAALRNLGSDVEEAARVAGASPFRVARDVSLPMVMPAMLFSGVLVVFLGFEVFGLPLVLGDPEGHLVLATYLYKLTNKLGIPSYHLMAAVAVCLIAITFPLVLLQRRLLRSAQRFVALKGKAGRQHPLSLGPWRYVALAIVLLWLFLTVVVPITGIALRSVVSHWGEGVSLLETLTLDHYALVFEEDNIVRAIVNTLGVGIIGGALAVGFTPWSVSPDIAAMTGRARAGLPGAAAARGAGHPGRPGLPVGVSVRARPAGRQEQHVVDLAGLHRGLAGLWHAAGAERLAASGAGAGGSGAQRRRVTAPRQPGRDPALDPFRPAVQLAADLHDFRAEYSTAVYLLSPGTEVIGSLLVSLWATGAVDQVAALSVINILMVGAGLALALRLGVKLHD